MDKQTLKAIFIGMIGFLSTTLPMIIALRPSPAVPCAASTAVAACTNNCCTATPTERARRNHHGRQAGQPSRPAELRLLQPDRRLATKLSDKQYRT